MYPLMDTDPHRLGIISSLGRLVAFDRQQLRPRMQVLASWLIVWEDQ